MEKFCPKCQQTKPVDQFRYRPDGVRFVGYCKSCTRLINRESNNRHRRAFKAKCIAYKGGKCQRCGYNRCADALEFHHRDEEAKEFSISRTSRRDFEAIKPELDKCDLVCSNCHREEHAAKFAEGVSAMGTE